MRLMKQTPPNGTAEQHVREIRRRTRKKYSAEEKIRIVISGLRGEHSIAELCRREVIAESLYCQSSGFLRLVGGIGSGGLGSLML